MTATAVQPVRPAWSSQREISARLFVSFTTVRTHMRSIFRKLDVTSRTEAVRRGRGLGLI